MISSRPSPRLLGLSPAGLALHHSKGRWILAPHLRLLNMVLMRLLAGTSRRVMLNVPPRFGKSELFSKYLPACYLGNYPDRHVMLTSYGADFAASWGMKAKQVMLDVGEEVYGLTLNKKSDHHWSIAQYGGSMQTAGVGGPLTGKGAHLLLIDDPIKNHKEAMSDTFRNHQWDWMISTALSRLEPKAAVAIVMCMTGETAVTMADGTWKRLDLIRPGDEVETWQQGEQVIRRVLNWIPQGEDDIYEIRTGNHCVRANGRHPFLVARPDGSWEWVRVGDLKAGSHRSHGKIRGDRVVTAGQTRREEAARMSVDHAWLLGYMFGDGWLTRRDTTQHGWKERTYPRRGWVTCVALSADAAEDQRVADLFQSLFDVLPRSTRYGYRRTERQLVGQWFAEAGLIGRANTKRIPAYMFRQPPAIREAFLDGFAHADGHISKHGQAKGLRTIVSCNEDLIRDIRHLARSLGYQPSNIHRRHGLYHPPQSPNQIEATSYDCSWTPRKCDEPFTCATIRSIRYVGRQPVYDLIIEGSECFLADGLVSHNTRWHEDDLCGRVLKLAKETGEQWEHISLPAICENEDSPAERYLGRKNGTRKTGELLWIDSVGERMEGPDQHELIWKLYHTWKPELVGVEATAYQLTLFQSLVREGLPAFKLKADSDKVSRFLPAGNAYKNGIIYHKLHAEYLAEVEPQLLIFPNAEHDDYVDTCSYAVRMLHDVLGGGTMEVVGY